MTLWKYALWGNQVSLLRHFFFSRALLDRLGFEPKDTPQQLVAALHSLHASASSHKGQACCPVGCLTRLLAKRAMTACLLTAQPSLIEPLYLVEIQVPSSHTGTIYSCLSYKRGNIFSEEHMQGTPLITVKGHLPVLESFGFNEYVRSQTSGKAFTQCVFDHWEMMSSDPLDKESKTHKIILETRKRKKIEENIPPLERFLDKL